MKYLYLKYIKWQYARARLRRQPSPSIQMMLTPSHPSLTWTCMVCYEDRPDSRIDVHTSIYQMGGGIVMRKNVRYCNDRPSCINGAAGHLPVADYFAHSAADEAKFTKIITANFDG